MAMDYKDAGVDVERGYEAVRRIKDLVKATFDENVLTDIGDFGGIYALPGSDGEQLLVAGTDGVGTKLKLAFASGRHDSIGQDCVAMCVNDIICAGAKPLFFLDYLATGRIDATIVAEIVGGIAGACRQVGAALLGGETAEMPGFYAAGEYDLAGFAVGLVQRSQLPQRQRIQAGDCLIGLASSGIHSNGYSLVRKLFPEGEWRSDFNGRKLLDVLLEPTALYVQPVLQLLAQAPIRGLAHITGGGFIENIPRALPSELGAEIYLNSWTVPDIFAAIAERAALTHAKMFNTFNMGIGFVLVVPAAASEAVLRLLADMRVKAALIGRVKTRGSEAVWFA
jgi:phosphoribosylformylglycinamidine cyclo-ligase